MLTSSLKTRAATAREDERISAMGGDDKKAERRAQCERDNHIRWAYVGSGITLVP